MAEHKSRKRAANADTKPVRKKAAARKAASRAKPAAAEAASVGSLRGRVPALSPLRVEALRRLFGEPHTWWLGDRACLRVDRGWTAGAGETFTVEAEGTPLQLRLDDAGEAGELHWSTHRGRARLLAWSVAHERTLMQLSEALGTSLLPVEHDGHGDGDGEASAWIDFCIHGDDGSAIRGAMGLPTHWIERLVARAEPPAEGDPPPDLQPWLDLPLALTVGFSGPTLDADAWQRLRPGDVVLAGREHALAVEARAAGRAWSLAADPGGWRVDGTPRILPSALESTAMNETESAPTEDGDVEGAADGHPARSLPVQLAFEIGKVELAVGELATLQPGYVFMLPANLEGANVTVRANGRTVGRGEVVAAGDTLGVRLIAWN